MKKNAPLPRIVLVSSIVILLTSCWDLTPYPYNVPLDRQKQNAYYFLPFANTPLLFAKNQGNVTTTVTTSSLNTNFQMQGAFMASEHIGLMANLSFSANNSGSVFSVNDRFDNATCSNFELGTGYAKNISKNIFFETYGGFGFGKIRNYHFTGQSTIGLNSFFIQPLIAINDERKTVQFAFVSKFSGVNFKVRNTTFDKDREKYSSSQLQSLDAEPFHMFWEPGFIFRFGWDDVQFHTGYQFSADLTNPDLNREKGSFSAGLVFRFRPKKSTPKTKKD